MDHEDWRNDVVYEWLAEMMYFPDDGDCAVIEYESGPAVFSVGTRFRTIVLPVFGWTVRVEVPEFAMPMYAGAPMVFRATMFAVNRCPVRGNVGVVRLNWN